jgi:two-component system NtrC family sensor kinase
MTRIRPSSLRARIAFHVALLVIGSLVIGLGAAVGIQSLHRDMGVAVSGYRQLRQVYEVGFHVASAREALRDGRNAPALSAIETAIVKLDSRDGSAGGSARLDAQTMQSVLATLRHAAGELQKPSTASESSSEPADASLNRALGTLANISATIRQSVTEHENAAERHRRALFVYVCAVSAAVLIAGVIVGIRLYRSVMRPLDQLTLGVRRFAGGQFAARLSFAGDREFALLASDFNRMAGELQTLYDDLERRVDTKSRQLAQSERLASVGYLAAGVAHEINNPLGIIAGYGERSLQMLDRGLNPETAQSVNRAIGIICDEAFRCKQITDRLLMLARPGEPTGAPMSLARVASDVITSVGGLARFADRKITLATDADASLLVRASEGELRQVVLNLVVNALEAVAPGDGNVQVSVRRDGDEIELSVRDNGPGMSSETLARVFEPFFTEKRGVKEGDRPGTGLGLSVAHAIVTERGGRIEAHSEVVGDGPVAGSQFIVRLPASEPTDHHGGNHVARA